MKVDFVSNPCVYMLLHGSAGEIFGADIPGISYLKIGCTRGDLASRIRCANTKYKTKFQLLAFMPVSEEKLFATERSIKNRLNESFGSATEYVLISNENISHAVEIFREEVCRAG